MHGHILTMLQARSWRERVEGLSSCTRWGGSCSRLSRQDSRLEKDASFRDVDFIVTMLQQVSKRGVLWLYLCGCGEGEVCLPI